MTLTVTATVETIFTRGPRFVAHATCPSCNVQKLGITYHGVLSSGRKIFELAAHSKGLRAVKNKEGRCEGSGLRMHVTPEGWRPAP